MRIPEPLPQQREDSAALADKGPSHARSKRPLPRHTRLVCGLAFAALLAVVFGKALFMLALHAAGSDLHSHILLVPVISAYLIYLQRERLPHKYSPYLGGAALFFVIGLLALAAAWVGRAGVYPLSHNDYLALMAFSFVSVLAAGGFGLLGKAWMVKTAFPFFFLLFMIPLPDRAVDWLETASKLASAEAAHLFFSISGIPYMRDKLLFHLPTIVLEVAQECSGIRSSFVLFITSLLAAHLFLTSPWRQALLVAVVIPLGILRNGFRILVIGWLCVEMGPDMIHSIAHRRGGPLFFALSLIPLFLLLWWLRRGEVGKARDRKLPSV